MAINLSELDGSDGFQLDGYALGGLSGWKVAGAGDVNGDGIDDVIVSDPAVAAFAGASFLVFGSTGGFPASIDLATLDGWNGFRVDGIDPDDMSGWFLAAAGDVNDDEVDDLIVGTSASGESYVVFGTRDGFGASIDLSALDGSTGFRLDSPPTSTSSGRSVAGVGDINGDGIDDVIVGAYGSDPDGKADAGVTYVVFGSDTGFPASLDLEDLDGSDGFRLVGVAAGDMSGYSVAGAGDVNGDGEADLIIGAPGVDSGGQVFSGESYVVFGSSAGGAATIDLSELDGSNGFRLAGAEESDLSGRVVSTAGDVNGDGIGDIMIAAPYADFNRGAVYVVFGTDAPVGPTVDLSTLNGTNGFRLVGTVRDEGVGRSVASAGDFNGDGFGDLLVGLRDHEYNYGATHIVFGAANGFAPILELASLDASRALRLEGTRYDQGPSAVAGAGDVNGDGFDDVIVGVRNVLASYVVFGFASEPEPGSDVSVPSDSDASPNAVAENAAFGAVVGLTAAASDPDAGDTVSYSLSDDAGGRFAIDAATGVVTVAGPIDYETAQSHAITVRALSSDGSSAEQGFVIAVANLNDAPLVLTGTGGANVLTGGFDNDTIDGLGGADTLSGGGGDDIIRGGNGTDALDGGEGDDLLDGGAAADALDGGDGDDVLDGGAATDALDGGDGDDVLVLRGAEARGDTLVGGSGTDTLQVDAAGGAVTLNGLSVPDVEVFDGAGQVVQGTSAADVFDFSGFTTVSGIASIEGLGGDDLITGSTSGDVINGGAGDDALDGRDGDDTLDGGAGADVLAAGQGDDVLILRAAEARFDTFAGEAGTDVLRVDASGGAVSLNALTVTDVEVFEGAGQVVQGTAAANVISFAAFDTVTGVASVLGLGGDDTLTGSNGDDVLDGGGGNDGLNGGGGNDDLRGGAGADVLAGGEGTDLLTGGGGADRFVFGGDMGADTVTDFDANPAGGQDLIDISAFGIETADFASDVTITDLGNDTQVSILAGSGTILLTGVTGSGANAIGIADFVLA